jgi:cytochrome c peroxidase
MLGSMALGAVLLLSWGAVAAQDEVPLNDTEALGKAIFFDTDLSINANQSCATCHDPAFGFTGPDSVINEHGSVYEGSIPGRFGDRRPPSSAYATQSPILFLDKKGTWVGGNFWDGRATGEKLGNPAADQAQGPFLNPVEQALPDSACVVYYVTTAAYPVPFTQVWGDEPATINWPADVETVCAAEETTVPLSVDDRAKSDRAYDEIALSIAAYEASPEVNAFTSKLDLKVKLTREERRGWALFNGKGGCSACHPGNGQQPLFTDYTFDNLGVPINPENPAWLADPAFVDPGLGGFLKNAGYSEDVYMTEWGKQKVPTLRNVAKGEDDSIVKAFTHNGYFKTLDGIVHFYNTRDVKPVCPGPYTEADALAADCWPAPEVAENVNTDELGDLGLSRDEEAAIVAFLRALSDGYGG